MFRIFCLINRVRVSITLTAHLYPNNGRSPSLRSPASRAVLLGLGDDPIQVFKLSCEDNAFLDTVNSLEDGHLWYQHYVPVLVRLIESPLK